MVIIQYILQQMKSGNLFNQNKDMETVDINTLENVKFSKARSAFRKNEKVYVFNDKNELVEVGPYVYEDYWGIIQKEISRHAFFFSCQKLREELKLKKLKYFINK